MLQVRFRKCFEIRMGSPYENCSIRVQGDWIPPELETEREWVHIKAVSEDDRYLALAYWETPDNQPGFRILIIDLEQRTVLTSDHLPGCCDHLRFTPERLDWKAFPDHSGHITLR